MCSPSLSSDKGGGVIIIDINSYQQKMKTFSVTITYMKKKLNSRLLKKKKWHKPSNVLLKNNSKMRIFHGEN